VGPRQHVHVEDPPEEVGTLAGIYAALTALVVWALAF
jgi:hypothetical protein